MNAAAHTTGIARPILVHGTLLDARRASFDDLSEALAQRKDRYDKPLLLVLFSGPDESAAAEVREMFMAILYMGLFLEEILNRLL